MDASITKQKEDMFTVSGMLCPVRSQAPNKYTVHIPSGWGDGEVQTRLQNVFYCQLLHAEFDQVECSARSRGRRHHTEKVVQHLYANL